MRRAAAVLAALAAAAARAEPHRVHGDLCARCKSGGPGDGGLRVDSFGCLAWCSPAGFCGDGAAYRRGLDCRHRTDVPAAAKEAAARQSVCLLACSLARSLSCRPPRVETRVVCLSVPRREERYDSGFMQLYGSDKWERHKREWDHAEKFGRAISIRGERHCGTGWVRVMTNLNCASVRHYWSPNLDSDGLYGWKHDYLPESFSARSRDAMLVVYRNAAAWAPKMRKAAYSAPIERVARAGGLAAFLGAPFQEGGLSYAHILDLRTRKYAQYLDFGRTRPNVLGVRYEDLLRDPTFLYAHLARKLGFRDCLYRPAEFKYVRGYAKYGGVSQAAAGNAHAEKGATWPDADWAALTTRLDYGIEARLGYHYDATAPGRWEARPDPADRFLLRPNNTSLADHSRRR